ncbi:unnamed protein product [Clonostachys rosea]|uniref:Uncharacterized protein n=1 Tax=Bionectria ochroleuca TaxID=29856 RepID=A0ABY6V3C5_BIOOC|nr:unnamed protein product [Clonostachys rosea]
MPANTYFVNEERMKYVPPYWKDSTETREPVLCNTEGNWPQWLHGTMIRMGMGPYTVPLSTDGSKPNALLQHWFDGLATLHKFEFSGGQVIYRSRYTAEGVMKKAREDGYLSTMTFGLNPNTPLKESGDPCWAKLGNLQSVFYAGNHPGPDDLSVSVVPRRSFHVATDGNPNSRGTPADNPAGEEIMCGTDFNLLQICDAKTLEPKRMVTYATIDPELQGYGICSHPPKDRQRQHLYNYLIGEDNTVYVFSLDFGSNPSKLVWKTALPCAPCYVHSLAMSKKYCVFVRNEERHSSNEESQPLHMDLKDPSKPLAHALTFEPESKTLFFILDKDTGKLIAQYATPHFAFYHAINGYDYVDKLTGLTNIHIDLCVYPADARPFDEFQFSNILDPAGPLISGTLARYELAGVDNPKLPASVQRLGTVVQMIPDCPSELPRINKYYSCNPNYRYVWTGYENGGTAPGTLVPIGRLSSGIKQPSRAFMGGIAKADWQTGKHIKWFPSNGESGPCEPIFVGRPGAVDEDDGVVLTIVINREGTSSILIVLDGRTMVEVARAFLPQVYGLGPHGSFIEPNGEYYSISPRTTV